MSLFCNKYILYTEVHKGTKNKVVCINFENSFLSIYKDIWKPLNFIDEEKWIFKIKGGYFNLPSI